MIKQMRVQNFKAIRDVTVDLEPFTVLIGPNDTGKSTFLEALFAIAESTRSKVPNCFWSDWQGRELVYQHAQDELIQFTAQVGNSTEVGYELSLKFTGGKSCQVSLERIGTFPSKRGEQLETAICEFKRERPMENPDAVRQAFQHIAAHLMPPTLARWNIEDLAKPSWLKGNREHPFDSSGYGLATFIAELKLEDMASFIGLRDHFCDIFSAYREISIKRTVVEQTEITGGSRKPLGRNVEGYALSFVRKDDVVIPAPLASGGMLVTLAFLALIHQREPAKFLLIEEPENGVHPSRLQEIIKAIRCTVESHPGAQVVLTTHSPLLLNYVDPREVRVFLRNKEKGNDVEVYDLSKVPDIHDRLKYMMLGELVYNEGEEELVKEIQHAHSDSGRRSD